MLTRSAYGYTGGNPLNRRDPSGLAPCRNGLIDGGGCDSHGNPTPPAAGPNLRQMLLGGRRDCPLQMGAVPGPLFRYVGPGELDFFLEHGYLPNTNALGEPKNIFLTPNEYSTVEEAQSGLQLPEPPYARVSVDPESVDALNYAGNVASSTDPEAVEVTTDEVVGGGGEILILLALALL